MSFKGQKISVIIPVYNVEHYLKECLDSVVMQDYTNKEVILVDDGSTDGSGRICEEYAARYPFIKVIHKNNGGLSSARNRGMDEASGQWMIFLDSDDVWGDAKCLSTLYSYAMSLKLDVLRFEYQGVNEKLDIMETRIYDKSNLENRVIDNYTLVKLGISGEWFAVLYLLRKDVVENIRFNEKIKFQEDIEFYSRFFINQEYRCGYLDRKFYLYRKRTQSLTSTLRVDNLKGSFELSDTFYECSLLSHDDKLKKLYVYYSIMMYYWTLQTLASDQYYHNRNLIIKDLQLRALHRRNIERMKMANIENKYRIFIYPKPDIGVRILRVKDKIRKVIPWNIR